MGDNTTGEGDDRPPWLEDASVVKPGQKVRVIAKSGRDGLTHEFGQRVWKLREVPEDTDRFDQHESVGLVLTVRKEMKTDQQRPNFVFVDDVVDTFDSSDDDDRDDSHSQNISSASKRQKKSAENTRTDGDLMSDINSGKM